MKITNDILDLVDLSRKVGGNVAYVQGGGGNTSFKNGSKTLYVKASGFCLKDISFAKGIVPLYLEELRAYLRHPDTDENTFASAMRGFVQEGGGRPSIEVGFHAVIPFPFVLHTHSVYMNILACSEEGKYISRKLFGDDILWIDYQNPGVEILNAFISAVENNHIPKYIILQNHGFITYGNSGKEVLATHSSANNAVIAELGLSAFKVNYFQQEFVLKEVLFPDQIVYMSQGADRESSAYLETLSAAIYILDSIRKCGLTPMFIRDDKIAQILGMESEEYRRSISR